MKSRKTKWILRINSTDGLNLDPRTVHQILRQRRSESRQLASTARHCRSVAKGGDDGHRCYECRDVPLLPWEPVYPRDKMGMTYGDPL